MPSVIELLKKDHRNVEQLFARIETAKEAQEREALFTELATELEAHATAEESAVYPRVEQLVTTEKLAEHSMEEHDEARELVAEITSLNPESDEWLDKVDELKEAIQHHVEEEETEMFPAMEKLMTPEILAEMAENVERDKQKFELAG